MHDELSVAWDQLILGAADEPRILDTAAWSYANYLAFRTKAYALICSLFKYQFSREARMRLIFELAVMWLGLNVFGRQHADVKLSIFNACLLCYHARIQAQAQMQALTQAQPQAQALALPQPQAQAQLQQQAKQQADEQLVIRWIYNAARLGVSYAFEAFDDYSLLDNGVNWTAQQQADGEHAFAFENI